MEKWSKEETIVAFSVYCKIPFKDSSKNNPTIIKYAKILGRTPSALNMKIGNIGRLDPDLKKQGITGLEHGAKLEKEIWTEFYDNPEKLAYESARILAKLAHQSIETCTDIDISDLPKGEERAVVIKQRVNQSFFRSAVMSAYNFHCCISGVGNPTLLEACHIVDWSQDKTNRTNPKNGLCLNPFFHKAYDKLLIAITPDLSVIISDELIQNTTDDSFQNYLREINGRKMLLPDRFCPQKELLEIHYEQFRNR
ncbi:MAG: HNH endonuclease [Alistipes sp.]